MSEWYRNTSQNDLQYWGLDYPPLTAYLSWVCGHIAHVLDPTWMALGASRGFESPALKLFMRGTVLAADVLVLFPALIACFLWRRTPQCTSLAAALVQPALILIDHGHFQYNNVSLGLSLLAVVVPDEPTLSS